VLTIKFSTLAVALSLIAGLALGGCSNTFDGAGKDIERAGQAVQRTF
jgi:predicted small secreted protein